MADSIHDQWPLATSEWQRITTSFNRAWVSVVLSYAKNSDYAGFAAAINYLALMVQDVTVMEGDMLTHVAQSAGDAARGTVNNFAALQSKVLPQWGYLAAAYTNAQVYAAVNLEQSQRQAAIAAEAAQRAIGDDQTRIMMTAAVNQEAAQRVLGDTSVMTQLMGLIQQEAVARAAGDTAVAQQLTALIAQVQAQLSAQIQQVLTYAQGLPGLIDTRAANGYDPTLRARGNLVQRILDTAVAHDPAVAGLVSKLAGFIVDLIEVDDPLIRVAAQLVLKQVIDHLGLNSALHAMIGDLLGQLIGGGQPKTLTAIMGDIGNRLDALESATAALSPLADEADQLHELGSVVFNVAILGYLTAAIADPVATANDTVTVVSPITGPILEPLRLLLGMPS